MRMSLIAATLALPLAVLVQAKPQPADPTAAVPALRYESALAGYRAFKDEKPPEGSAKPAEHKH